MDDLSPRARTIRRPAVSILITILIFFIGFQLLGPAIGALIAIAFYPGSEVDFNVALQAPLKHPEIKMSLLIMQAVGAVIGMVVIPFYFLRLQRRNLADLFNTPYLQPAFIIAILVVVFMGFNSVFIKWNQQVDLPYWIEDWAKPMEEKFAELTTFMTTYESTAQLVFAFVVIAILPAIGEEIIFRGMIQNDLMRATRNAHISIWFAAFLFSAMHFQFYGFVPRMLLGALFGYLYFWSRNLWMPVLAHFVNNGFTLVSLYLFQKGSIKVDIEKVEPGLTPVIISTVLAGFLLYVYKNFFDHHWKADIPD